jgi:hypothetical protein
MPGFVALAARLWQQALGKPIGFAYHRRRRNREGGFGGELGCKENDSFR